MSIKFTSKNVKFTGALKAFTEKHLKGIEKIGGDIIDAEVIISEEKLDFKVEITLKTKLHSYHIQASDPILKQAIRGTLNTLKAQAKKNKEKMKTEKTRHTREGIYNNFVASEPEPPIPAEEVTDAQESRNLTISENFSRKPLSVEEAIFFLKESGENAYMFPNVETNKMSVIFYDNTRNMSIIETV